MGQSSRARSRGLNGVMKWGKSRFPERKIERRQGYKAAPEKQILPRGEGRQPSGLGEGAAVELEGGEDVFGVGAYAVVGVGFGEGDLAGGGDGKGGGDG